MRRYDRSLKDPEGFWGDLAEQFHWNKRWEAPFSRYNINLEKGPVSIEWFIGAETNVVRGRCFLCPWVWPCLWLCPWLCCAASCWQLVVHRWLAF